MKISYEQVIAKQDELYKCVRNMEEILNNVKDLNNKITGSEIWSGKGAEVYIQKLDKLLKDFDELTVDTNSGIKYMSEVVDAYRETDKSTISGGSGQSSGMAMHGKPSSNIMVTMR